MTIYRTIVKLITPDEARPTANKLLALADDVRALSNLVEQTAQHLDKSWTGGAKDKFFTEILHLHDELSRYAQHLEAKAAAIAAITVWAEFKEVVEDLTGGGEQQSGGGESW